MQIKSYLYLIAFTLLVIGGINWGLVGLFNLDLVALLFGEKTLPAKVIYSLVGGSALYLLIDKAMRLSKLD